MRRPGMLFALAIAAAVAYGCSLDNDRTLPLAGSEIVTPPSGNIPPPANTPGAHQFIAQLSGDQEVPPVATDAIGTANYVLSQDETMLKYRLVVNNLNGLRAAHIHQAPAGVNGPVIVNLNPTTNVGTSNGLVAIGEVAVSPAVVAAMRAGNTYTNVHTAAHPGGEIRGQITIPPRR